MITIEERKATLNAVIVKHKKNGWQVLNQTDTTCQITRENKPDTCLVVLLILCFVLPEITSKVLNIFKWMVLRIERLSIAIAITLRTINAAIK